MENHQSCSILSYSRGTASDNFHLTTTQKNMLLFSPGKSRLLTNLLYHILGVNNHFYLSIKFYLLQLRNTSPTFCSLYAFSEKLPHVLTSQPHFSNDSLLCFILITVCFLTYLVIFTPGKTLLIFQLSLTCPFYVYDQS